LDLLTSTKEAEKALEELIESRRTLATRHAKLESKVNRMGSESSDLPALQSEMANIAADMDLRSEQIVQLKQKIAAADLDNKAKTRWDYIQTMVEAKVITGYSCGSSRNLRMSVFVSFHFRRVPWICNSTKRFVECLRHACLIRCICRADCAENHRG
jgi:hypothetical protein